MERLAGRIGAEDVAHEADALLGPADLLEHARIGLVAAAQHLDLVAVASSGRPGQPADGEFERRQRIVGDSQPSRSGDRRPRAAGAAAGASAHAA